MVLQQAATPVRHEDLELLTVGEVLRILQVSRWQFYRLANSGQLPTISLGKSRRVRRAALRDFLSRLEREQAELAG